MQKDRNFVADFIRLELTFTQKTEKSLFESFLKFLDLIACWKARGQLCIRHNSTFFAISYG